MTEKLPERQDGSIIISESAADALIGSGSGNAALLYIYLTRKGGGFDPETAAKALLMTRNAAESAYSELKGLGIIGFAPLLRNDAPPEYSAEDVKSRLGESPEFSGLVQETQRRLGRVLSSGDLIILFGIFDYLGLPADVILMLLTHCIEETKKRYGEGRMPTLRYIEKEAYSWVRQGILTQAGAEEHLHRRMENNRRTEELRKALGINNRALSPTEEKYVVSWLDMGFGTEALMLAYDKTVVKTGALNWAYMNSIVKNWHSKGLNTLAEIKAGDGGRRMNKSSGKSESAPTQEEFERMKRYLDRLKSS